MSSLLGQNILCILFSLSVILFCLLHSYYMKQHSVTRTWSSLCSLGHVVISMAHSTAQLHNSGSFLFMPLCNVTANRNGSVINGYAAGWTTESSISIPSIVRIFLCPGRPALFWGPPRWVLEATVLGA
jgi:hypothetical protein